MTKQQHNPAIWVFKEDTLLDDTGNDCATWSLELPEMTCVVVSQMLGS